MKFFHKILGAGLLIFGILLSQNCFIDSISNSLSKSSDSLQSISNAVVSVVSSVSSSSKDEAAEKKGYKRDVENLTAFYLQTGSTRSSEFESDLAELASKNGVINWKNSESTYVSIGRGLKKAGVSEEGFKSFAANINFKPEIAKALERGYLSL
ncbi:putative lipoprotein [Leptospira selangorensis]|uniref:Lipoprotein n=1 Tax=Leptospira selangorensis TaxID=2484982 RepID=A0A4R9G3E3_9LEPT|nr:putative lipoprotein [Leptospira selangorensis]TGK05811.1 putative lipoprotein [Leptospira selangorensis]TGM12391.1 putative lipoprotein [Leptospira selangorensis]TGM14566.1 putative lipoprotein [Leptospira selangorensis]